MRPTSYVIDMDGVLMQGDSAQPGADGFLKRLREGGHVFLVLTNNSRFTPKDLSHRMRKKGLDVGPEHFFTSAMATAQFVHQQKPGGSAFVAGDTGLFQALHEVEYHLTEYNPDVVILGEMESYSHDKIVTAMDHILKGVPFIATNPDVVGPTEHGMIPACGAVAALLEKATRYPAYFVGKPNPLMMRLALRHIDEHSENAIMVGDNMETDIKVGLEAGLQTILVLSGVTTSEIVGRYPYRPNAIKNSVAEIDPQKT